MGSRQVFIRALAPKLSRDGAMVNELLLTDEQCNFEIAGHQFELIRTQKTNDQASPEKSPASKMKFTLARPMEIGQSRQQSVAPPAAPLPVTSPIPTFQSPTATSSALQPQWINELIQSAMRPLERQLQDIIEPLAAVQIELDKRARAQRKKSKRPPQQVKTPAEASLTTQIDVQSQISHIPEPVFIPIISPEIESQLAKQSNSLESLGERLTNLKSNFADLIPEFPPAIETQLSKQNETLECFGGQLTEMTREIGSLEQVFSKNIAASIETNSTTTLEHVDETLRQVTSVSDQLKALASQLEDVKTNVGSLERIVSENLSVTNELKAAPEPASNEALQRLSSVAEQLSQLLQDVNSRQIAIEDTDVAWREQLRQQIVQLQESVTAAGTSIQPASERRRNAPVQVQEPVLFAESASSSHEPLDQQLPALSTPASIGFADYFGGASTNFGAAEEEVTAQPPDFIIDEVVEDLPQSQTNSEVPVSDGFGSLSSSMPDQASVGEKDIAEDVASMSTESAWSAKFDEPEAEIGFLAEQNENATSSDSSAWSVGSSISSTPVVEPATSANFVEEVIEGAPLATSVGSELPSWWTDDDKTQFKDESSTSASSSSPWKSESSDSIQDLSAETSGTQKSTSVGNAFETSDYHASSGWDVQQEIESEPELQRPTAVEPVAEALSQVASTNELDDEETLSSDESQELSSLLERFGIAREPDAIESAPSFSDSEPITEIPKDAGGITRPNQDFAAFMQQTSTVPEQVDRTEIMRADSEPAPTTGMTFEPPEIDGSDDSVEGGEEESVEDYMKRLMARMRGGSAEEAPKPAPSPTQATSTAKPVADSLSTPVTKTPLPTPATERAHNNTTAPFNPEEYVPKALAPEKTRNMAAMRELANTSARSAIQVSARRRYGSAIALKLAIALTGLGVGITLLMLNGLNVNIGLIATVASFLVALIWGFDAVSTLKPLLYSAVEKSVPSNETPEAEA